MIWRMSEQVWFGDKPSVVEDSTTVRSIINVAHSIRKPYWENVGSLSWDIWYFKMACPDRVCPDELYLKAFVQIVEAVKIGGRFPLLCHCRVGGHRGPTAAVFAYWVLSGRKRDMLKVAIDMADRLRSGFSRPSNKRVYRNAVLDFCDRNSVV